MQLIDTHAHLDAEEFDIDREEVINRAKETGLINVMSIAIDLETAYKNLKLAKKYPFIYTSCGLHPNYGYKWTDEMEGCFRELMQEPKVLAIGESGLDYFRTHCSQEQQRIVLEKQMSLAKEADLPIILHCREAHEDLLKYCEEAYQSYGTLKGVIHCFSGGPAEAVRYVECGFYISFAGPLTYKKNDLLRDALKEIPKERILVETDCPYLAPQSKRGKRNEPAYVKWTAERAAQELELTAEELGQLVTENAIRLFNIPQEN